MSTVEDKPFPAGLLNDGGFPKLGRAAGAIWFLLLAFLSARATPALMDAVGAGRGSFAAWASVISQGCTLIFFIVLAWLMVARPPAAARRSDLASGLIALAGTYGAWMVAFLPQASLPPYMVITAAAVTLVGSLLIVFTVSHLGRSFSIAPQARSLVTRGPYALVRHPLYAAEEIAIIGLAMHVIWYAAVPFLAAHVALQLKRMSYEEQLLGEVFPPYEAYARRTARWVPGIW